MPGTSKYTPELQTQALELLRIAHADGSGITAACTLVASMIGQDGPSIATLRNWAKAEAIFPGADARLKYSPGERARTMAAVDALVATGRAVHDACRDVARIHEVPVDTVRYWHQRNEGAVEEPGASVKETALEMLRDARNAGIPLLPACTRVADEFTSGPDSDQLRDWALKEGVYTWSDRAYSPEFRQQATRRMGELVDAGATPAAASRQLAADSGMPTANTLRSWYDTDVSPLEEAADDDEYVDLDEIEYVDLDAFRAEVEAPLRAQIDRLLVEKSRQRDELDGAAAHRGADLERENARLTEELKQLRALVRHYLDSSD